MIVMVTATGEEHGLLKKLPNSVKEGFKNMSPEAKAEQEKLRKEASKMVKARYVNRQEVNGKLEKPYVQYAGDVIQIWRFLNNYEYEVPLGLVREVNGEKLPQRAKEEASDKKTKDDRPIAIHEFIPVGF